MNLFLEEQNIEVPNINTNTPKYPYDEEVSFLLFVQLMNSF